MAEKLVFMVTHGPADAELATLPFVMAAAALASDVEVVMGFQGEGVRLMQVGAVEGISVHGFEALATLLASVRELGGQLLVCGPCVKNRDLDPENMVPGAEIVAAARFIAEIVTATNSLVY